MRHVGDDEKEEIKKNIKEGHGTECTFSLSVLISYSTSTNFRLQNIYEHK